MKKQHIFVNFKRFDVPASLGGVNRISSMEDYSERVVSSVIPELKEYDSDKVRFVHYYPEAQLIGALRAKADSKVLEIGCQGVYRKDIEIGGNFGAFTTLRPAAAAKALGCTSTIIGHCEERNEKRELLEMAGVDSLSTVNKVLNMEVLAAQRQGLDVLFCIGERGEEVGSWDSVIRSQLLEGLKCADLSKIVIAYEPVWSIGPGKTPADKDYITKVARLVKETIGDVPVVYGGGLKESNAEMLASIEEIDGGLIALTRFTGEIGFYPEEYINIIKLYMSKKERL